MEHRLSSNVNNMSFPFGLIMSLSGVVEALSVAMSFTVRYREAVHTFVPRS